LNGLFKYQKYVASSFVADATELSSSTDVPQQNLRSAPGRTHNDCFTARRASVASQGDLGETRALLAEMHCCLTGNRR